MNAAYSKSYRDWREKCGCVFEPEHRSVHRTEMSRRELDSGLRLEIYFYEGQVSGCSVHGSECQLFDRNGALCFWWRNLNNDGEFFAVINHSNGRKYLMFRCDLYGYAILDLYSMKDFQYLPDKAFPEDEKDFEETFIWTDVHYNPSNNLMAVSGCFWACPFSVIVLDFSNPMTENEAWTDLHVTIDDGYGIYDDIEFVRWESDGSLTVQGYNNNTAETDTLIFREDRLREIIGRKGL